MAKSKNPRPSSISLDAVLESLQIKTWDVLLVGDGSGSGWEGACGWGALLIDRTTRARRMFHGGMNIGSVNVAESMPYIQALSWYDCNAARVKLQTSGKIVVHIVTDSSTITGWLNAAIDSSRALPSKSGLVLGAYVRELQKRGFELHVHWARRMSTEMNWACDLIAGLSRERFVRAADTLIEPDGCLTIGQQAAQLLSNVEIVNGKNKDVIDVYKLNPYD